MGNIIDLDKARKAKEKEVAKKTEGVDVVEDIREFFKDVVHKKPTVELVEKDEPIDEGDFARWMMKIQSGEIKG